MKIELTKEQLNVLIQLVLKANIIGADAEFIVQLKQALAKAEEVKVEV